MPPKTESEEEVEAEFKLCEEQPHRNTGTYYIDKEIGSKRGTIESIGSTQKLQIQMKLNDNGDEIIWDNLPDFIREKIDS